MKSTAPAPLLTRSAVMRTLLEWPHTESPRHSQAAAQMWVLELDF